MVLIKSLTRDLGLTKRVSIEDVRWNPLNGAIYSEYEENDDLLIGLIESIYENGQMENAIVYEDLYNIHGQQDGKKYTLLGGNTRYLAISNLYASGRGDGMINITVVDKPQTHIEEMKYMIKGNIQRKKTIEERYNEIRVMRKVYNDLEEKPAGTKREWIGKQLGISGRYVSKILRKMEGTQDEGIDQNVDNDEDRVDGQTTIDEFMTHGNEIDDGTSSILDDNNENVTNSDIVDKDLLDLLDKSKLHLKNTTEAMRTRGLNMYANDIEKMLEDLNKIYSNICGHNQRH